MDRHELLTRVARLYYEEDLTQAEIAARTHVSRSTVSRLLDEARAKGIVEIIVHYPWDRVCHLEQALRQRFGLTEVIVLARDDLTYDDMLRGLGVLAARYLQEVLEDGMTLGIARGTAVDSTVRALKPMTARSVTVVQMIGAADADDSRTDSPQVAQALARKYGGRYRHLHAPLFVDSTSVRDALLRESSIRDTLLLTAEADFALVGIGAPQVSPLLTEYLNAEELAQLTAEGAVGDICARQYDIQGQVLDTELNHRVVGIDLETLHRVGQVIGVAGGIAKAESILGALRGEHVDVLVTDQEAACEVLRLDGAADAEARHGKVRENHIGAGVGRSGESDGAKGR
ncbi:MAG: sugar-binding transcriptional regulator [Anaerolineae bacterium]|jgi:DNA-binding transcriptional regulator LsrR (DeoR family)